jgi:pyruvate kinase
MRRTKIVATLGPATDSPAALESLVLAGVDVVRVNFSHGSAEDQIRRVGLVRQIAEKHRRYVGVLADLQGPKIRIERFESGTVTLAEGDAFVLDTAAHPDKGNQGGVGITYKDLPRDVHGGDTLLLDDGHIVLTVDSVNKGKIQTHVKVGGQLTNNKGINRLGGGLSADALTDKDRRDIAVAAQLQADYLAVSFPRSAADVEEAKALLRKAGGHAAVMAKIERAEAVEAIDEIVMASDAVMIARGDLGVEIGDAELPAVQKRIIQLARSLDRVVVTATEMMQSMVASPVPTRAEVFDVANAVLDGTDAVMLSAESATGKYPAKAVEAMARICAGAEKHRQAMQSNYRINTRFQRADEAIAMASMYTANHLGVTAIAALTESGSTPLWMSRISSGIPIYALTPHENTLRKVTLYRGVYPLPFRVSSFDHAHVNLDAIRLLESRGAVKDGDLVIITKGDLMGRHGGTNAMKIVKVGDMVQPQDG